MSITAFSDLSNSSICFALGIYTLVRALNVFKSKHTEFMPLLIVSAGTFAWLVKFMLSLAPIAPVPLAPEITWGPNHGYTLGRVLLMPSWIYLLYLIKQTKN